MTSVNVTYTDPVLCTYGLDISKPWFVHFYITNETTGEKLERQFRGGINYSKNKEERLRLGNALKSFWKGKLKNGWHPFKNLSTTIFDLNNMHFNEAVDFAVSKCVVSKKTKADYKCTCGFFKDAAMQMHLNNIKIQAIKRQHIKLMLEHIKTKRKWSNKAYNKNVGYFSSVMEKLVEWEILEYNPVRKIKSLPTTETQKFIPYTPDEKKKITVCLYLNHYRFFVYLQIIYHTGIRPKEILALKIKNIDLNMQIISIVPDMDQENSKTKSIRIVPINNQLLPYLRELKLHEYDAECYLFGSPYESGKGNKGSAAGKLFGAMHPDFFKPSYTRIKRDTVTKLWNKIVIKKLGINKYLYAGKHTGANDKIIAGVPLEALQEMYGHHSKMMTRKYASAVVQIYHKQIKEQSPAF